MSVPDNAAQALACLSAVFAHTVVLHSSMQLTVDVEREMAAPPRDAEAATGQNPGYEYHFHILDCMVSFRDRSAYLFAVISLTTLAIITAVLYTTLVIYIAVKSARCNEALEVGEASKQFIDWSGAQAPPGEPPSCEFWPHSPHCPQNETEPANTTELGHNTVIPSAPTESEEEPVYSDPSESPGNDAPMRPHPDAPMGSPATDSDGYTTIGPGTPRSDVDVPRDLPSPSSLQQVPVLPPKGISISRICSCSNQVSLKLKCSCWDPDLSAGANTTFRLFVIASDAGAVTAAQLTSEV